MATAVAPKATAFVTGGSYGVGAAAAYALAHAGFAVVVSATKQHNLVATMEKLRDVGARRCRSNSNCSRPPVSKRPLPRRSTVLVRSMCW
jgi:NAD(P)-dependent dehydrogenase (short-subunit alcohol dehydrogenase family)